jgi:hypothetical protein
MGLILDDLDDHEGFADRRLADGRLAGGAWSHEWRAEHGEPLLARQATQRREELAGVLGWLGDQGGQLDDPPAVARVARAVDRAGALLEAVQRDLEWRASEREAGGDR